jgi:hypothetical protein
MDLVNTVWHYGLNTTACPRFIKQINIGKKIRNGKATARKNVGPLSRRCGGEGGRRDMVIGLFSVRKAHRAACVSGGGGGIISDLGKLT